MNATETTVGGKVRTHKKRTDEERSKMSDEEKRRANCARSKARNEERRKDRAERDASRPKLSPEGRLKQLDGRLGKGVGAVRERARLLATLGENSN